MFLFQKIEEVLMNHNDAIRAVGEFVLHEQLNLYKYTISEIAERSFTSNATVVRFAKKLGFEGWKEFIRAFISELRYQEAHKGDVDFNYPFSEKDSTSDIIQKIKELHIESIQDTYDIIDLDMIELATEFLLKAKHVVIFGLSPNIFLGEIFRRKLITIGKQIDIARMGETGIIAQSLGPDDCAIILSYSGDNEFQDPVSRLETLLKNNVSVIGITSGGDNYIRRKLKCVITMSSKERLFTKISNFATEQSITFIFNVLFSCYFSKNYQQNNLFKVRNSKSLELERKTTLKDIQDDMLE